MLEKPVKTGYYSFPKAYSNDMKKVHVHVNQMILPYVKNKVELTQFFQHSPKLRT